MKHILIFLVMACCMSGCSKPQTVGEPAGESETSPQPKAADVTHVSPQQFTSILAVAPSTPHSKKFLGYESGLAYLEVVEEKNGVKEKEIYCTPKKDLPKHTVDSLELMGSR